MRNTNPETLNISQNNTEIISLFIQLHKGELNLECGQEISSIIESCEECKNLYDLICDFYDVNSVLQYEIENPDRIQTSRSALYNLMEQFPPESNEQSTDFQENILGRRGDCFC